MATKLRVGVIGTGFGSTVQIPAFRAHPRVEVVAVASGRPGKARKVAEEFGVPHAFDAYADLVPADLDLVSITAPPDLHHPMTMAAVAAGRHVLCEKPMALSAAEAAEMLAAAERARVVHLIDHELRFNPNRRKVKRLIAEGFLGQPRHALITAMSPGRRDPTLPWGWWYDAARGGGLLGAVGSHQIDLLRYWLGEIESASGTLDAVIRERPAPDGSGRRLNGSLGLVSIQAPQALRRSNFDLSILDPQVDGALRLPADQQAIETGLAQLCPPKTATV